MPAEPGLAIGSGRPRVHGSSAASRSGKWQLCDSFAEKNASRPSSGRPS